MAKYNWTIDDIQERLNECIMLWDKEQDPDLKELYFRTGLNLRKFLEEQEDKNNEKLLNLYTSEKDVLNSVIPFWSLYQDFSRVNNTRIQNVSQLKQCSLTPKDILTFTHDFYKSLGSFFFNHFMKIFLRRNDHTMFLPPDAKVSYAGMTLYIPHNNEAFIQIYREYTINDIITSIHEYAHGTSYSINFLNLFAPHYFYTEIITAFFEMIGADFLSSTFGQENSTIIKATNHNTMVEIGKVTSHKIDLITAESLLPNGYQRNKDLKKVANELLELDSAKTEYLFSQENLDVDNYIMGYIIAMELYFIYLEDRDKALYILKKMLLQNAKSELDYFINIKKLGIIPNFHTLEYRNQLDQSVQKLTRKSS
ncbi:MAG: hypothetical protein E7161_01930 [Firmicutes bacterium]|nr:hypothetical protein [Bacillota bacterium]